jgi:hypothetical protein
VRCRWCAGTISLSAASRAVTDTGRRDACRRQEVQRAWQRAERAPRETRPRTAPVLEHPSRPRSARSTCTDARCPIPVYRPGCAPRPIFEILTAERGAPGRPQHAHRTRKRRTCTECHLGQCECKSRYTCTECQYKCTVYSLMTLEMTPEQNTAHHSHHSRFVYHGTP